MEILRNELKKVSEIAPKGSHKTVSEKIGYSEQYLQQIREGKNALKDNVKNRALIQLCLNEYRKIIRREVDKLIKSL